MKDAISRAYRYITAGLRLAVGAFFRRVEVEGLANVPTDGGGLVVSWHPNGLVDPGLILTHFPRRVVFGARHGLFAYPILGSLLRRVGTVPIYRASDARGGGDDARRIANRKSVDALAGAVAGGAFAALFPEGDSHDKPHLLELKRGAARLYYRARQLAGSGVPIPAILPVGLHYDAKQMFRSNALVAFHEPLVLPPALDVTPEGALDHPSVRPLVVGLTELIESTLRDAVHATEDWPLYHLMHAVRRLVRAERASRANADPGSTLISERVLGFARVRAGYLAALERDPTAVAELRVRVESYHEDLQAIGLRDYDLDRDPRLWSGWLGGLLVLQAAGVFLLLPPLVAVGYLANLPTTAVLWAAARFAARKRKDEATIKLLLGSVLYPATWVAVGVGAGLAHAHVHAAFTHVPNSPVAAGVTMAVLAALGGASAVRYWRLARETARAVQVRLTRRRYRLSVARLRRERGRLHDLMLASIAGVELPGEVAPDGHISA